MRLAELVGCFEGGDYTNVSMSAVAGCMQSVSAKELSAKQWSLQTQYFEPMLPPVVDGIFLQEAPKRSIEKGNFKKANLLLGANKDEGNYFLIYGLKNYAQHFPNKPPMSETSYLEGLRRVLGPNKLLYEMTKFVYDDSKFQKPDRYQILNDVAGDKEFLCPTVRFAKLFAEQQSSVYMYHFTHRSSTSSWPEWVGVLHADELEYIFGLPLRSDVKVMQPSETESDLYSASAARYRDNKFVRYETPQMQPHNQLRTSNQPAKAWTYSEYRLSWAMTKFWTNFAKTE